MAAFEANNAAVGKSVVIGIDLGTAYSGVSYFVEPYGLKASSPNSREPQVKEPTVLLQKENGDWLFGYDALHFYREEYNAEDDGEARIAKLKLFKLFKLELMNAEQLEFDQLTVNASNTGAADSLLDLISVTLRFLMRHGLECVRRNIGGIEANEVLWILTVPAQVGEYYKRFIREAARKAGMIRDSNSDDLKILLEPEAAALALAHHDGNNNGGFFSVGRKFLLVDCGGGTVDITSHESVSVNPLQLRSLAKSEGAKVGSEMVTKNFSAWLKGVISAVDEQAMKDMKRRGGAYFQVLEEFDKLKTSMTDAYNIPFINLRNLIEDYEDVVGRAFEEYNRNAIESMKVNYVKRTANLKLTKSLVKSFFEPLLVEIVESIGRVLDDATTRRNKVDFIAVVGGFAANKLLENRIRTSFVSPELGVLFPDLNMHPQAAVVIGAARGGALLGRKPGRDGDGGGDRGIINRIATKTIGVFFEPNKFQVLVKIGDDIPVNSVKELVGYPVNLTQTQCQWRLYQSDKENPTTTDGETLLGNVTVEVPQVGTIQEREMRAKIIFGEAEILVKIKLPQQNREFNGNLQFEKL